jgi:arylformamidase
MRRIPAGNGVPMVVGYGTGELKEFQRQSRDFVAAWRAKGNSCEELIFPSLNHYEVQEQFNEPDGPLVKAMLKMMGI